MLLSDLAKLVEFDRSIATYPTSLKLHVNFGDVLTAQIILIKCINTMTCDCNAGDHRR